MQAGVGAVICSVVLDMGKGIIHSRNISSILIMVISFCITYFLNINTTIYFPTWNNSYLCSWVGSKWSVFLYSIILNKHSPTCHHSFFSELYTGNLCLFFYWYIFFSNNLYNLWDINYIYSVHQLLLSLLWQNSDQSNLRQEGFLLA